MMINTASTKVLENNLNAKKLNLPLYEIPPF